MNQLNRISMTLFLSGLLLFSSFGSLASDRFNWSSNVWVQPTWSSSWGHNSNYNSGWRVGIGTGSPYWGNHSWNNGWNHGLNSGYRPYWRNSWRYPYRYNRDDNYYYNERRAVKRAPTPPKSIAAPQRVTSSVQYATGLKSLPENARVVQRDGRTIYEWQGVEYVFDWSSETYRELK
ncbi:hypothetical protein FM038_022760 [Shewanella eurypsychrophilus]|uniref:Uncharacterized protein n=1 Tax=Shewanella eurypsychrophilus TaxID=2593656 RepID=A0ABX6VBR7_9GAMM|nr:MULTISPECIES: hypothetical protein [Shewanella]QFU24679.1 hypothetical protein FS418_24425 [Shewanella sp. YLB-09]QPG59871.1 hypothetical protein FM038_022760 [Shewanella eurypsychrophilus]